METITNSKQETQVLAEILARHLKPGMLIRLEGQLGSGKTTFVQGVGKALGVKRAINSPTYTIVKEYPIEIGTLVHVDAYRLENSSSDTIDLPSILDGNTIAFVEWAEYIEDDLPLAYLTIKFNYLDETQRKIEFIANGSKYQQIVNQMIQAEEFTYE